MIHNGLNGKTGASLFKNVRPAFDGFGFGEQPDPKVREVLANLVKQLATGFHDVPSGINRDQFDKLKDRLTYLEDEKRNGIQDAQKKRRDASNELGKIEKKRVGVQTELGRLMKQLDQYAKRRTAEKTDDGSMAVMAAVAVDTELEKLKKAIAEKQAESGELDRQYIDATTSLRNAEQHYQARLDKVQLDLDETRRKLQDEEQRPADADYGKRFDLYQFVKDQNPVGRIKLSRKIGSDPNLHSLYVVMEDRLENSRLPFNPSLFYAEEDLLRFAFLRAYYLDGLRDADAIAERVADEREGGAKHIYDFVVEQVVRRVVRDRKLN
ncbi:hypothetical protein ACAW74_13910 [Fibrella sp. WM1]|uniref:hypothetical protein n=1 Tax=Fibrella musci TaxID=3242485 RepID=UPI00352165E4